MSVARFSLLLTPDAASHFERYSQAYRMTHRAMIEAAALCVSAFCKSHWKDELLEALPDVSPAALSELVDLAWRKAKEIDETDKEEPDRVRFDVRIDQERLDHLRECAHGAGLSMNGALATVFSTWNETKDQRQLRWAVFRWGASRANEEAFLRHLARRRSEVLPAR